MLYETPNKILATEYQTEKSKKKEKNNNFNLSNV